MSVELTPIKSPLEKRKLQHVCHKAKITFAYRAALQILYWLTLNIHYLFFVFLLVFSAEKANENFYTNRRHGVELTTTLPLHPVQLEPEPTNPYSPELPCQKQNGHKAKSVKVSGSHPLPYSSNTISAPGMLRSREGTDALGRRHTYGPKKHSTLLEQVNELSSQSQLYLPPHPYYISNSKTEVTV